MPRKMWEDLERMAKLNKVHTADTFVLSPNGTWFIIGNVVQWSLVDADCHVIKELDMGMLHSIRDEDDTRFKFSADSSIFFCVVSGSCSDDKSTMRVFDSVTGEQRARFKGLKKVHSLLPSANGAWIACGHGSGQLDVFRVASRERLSLGVSDGSPINVLLFSDDAEELVGGSKPGVVRVWDLGQRLDGHGACVLCESAGRSEDRDRTRRRLALFVVPVDVYIARRSSRRSSHGQKRGLSPILGRSVQAHIERRGRDCLYLGHYI
ncbi:hypothetical protein OG21DRAFT_1500784 [Imleria badia]|jgi:WD40 repeat protein|nr:hypothetical protein OG21DRAFT_1500784 [Imleria badia]